MKAAFLVKQGSPENAFEFRDIPKPVPGAQEVLIKVEGFGLNFADVMARLGHYRDAPPLPSLLGYDVVGRIESVGDSVDTAQVGDRVTALTRFGGYAEYAIADARAIAQVANDMEAGVAVALSTQYCTAYVLAEYMIRLHPGDHVLIHAAAGGVGGALVQLAKHHGCVIFGTAGSAKKLEYLRNMGVHHPINYREVDFAEAVRKITGQRGLDFVFDPVGGKSVEKGYGLLGAGGRIICFGGSSMTETKNIFGKIRVAIGFGFYSPVGLLTRCKGIQGVNMLRIADQRPEIISRAIKQVVEMAEQGIFKPMVGGIYSADQLAEAHRFLESRQSIGKIVLIW